MDGLGAPPFSETPIWALQIKTMLNLRRSHVLESWPPACCCHSKCDLNMLNVFKCPDIVQHGKKKDKFFSGCVLGQDCGVTQKVTKEPEPKSISPHNTKLCRQSQAIPRGTNMKGTLLRAPFSGCSESFASSQPISAPASTSKLRGWQIGTPKKPWIR